MAPSNRIQHDARWIVDRYLRARDQGGTMEMPSGVPLVEALADPKPELAPLGVELVETIATFLEVAEARGERRGRDRGKR